MVADRRSPQQSAAPEKATLIDEAVAVVIVNYRTSKLTAKCLAALERERSAFRKFQVFVVDGGSGDGSAEELSELVKQREYRDWVDFLRLPLNGGFGWANNQAIQRLMRADEPPEYIHLLNPDAKIETGAVRALAEYLNGHPRAGAVGSQLFEPNGSRSGSAFTFPSIRGEFSRGASTGALDRLFKTPPISIPASVPLEVDWVTGASVMLRVEALRQTGLFDEGFFLYNEEVELMWRFRKACWTVVTEPRSRVQHIGGSATGVHDRRTISPVKHRRPIYVYRSRTRLFGLTRGPIVASLAFAAWLAGHGIWRMRCLFGLGRDATRVDHELRNHALKGYPRKHDFVPAAACIDSEPTNSPAWMDNGWL